MVLPGTLSRGAGGVQADGAVFLDEDEGKGGEVMGDTEGQELIKLRDFFKANAVLSRNAANKTDNPIGHGVHTGEAVAFEAASNYCEMAFIKLKNQKN